MHTLIYPRKVLRYRIGRIALHMGHAGWLFLPVIGCNSIAEKQTPIVSTDDPSIEEASRSEAPPVALAPRSAIRAESNLMESFDEPKTQESIELEAPSSVIPSSAQKRHRVQRNPVDLETERSWLSVRPDDFQFRMVAEKGAVDLQSDFARMPDSPEVDLTTLSDSGNYAVRRPRNTVPTCLIPVVRGSTVQFTSPIYLHDSKSQFPARRPKFVLSWPDKLGGAEIEHVDYVHEVATPEGEILWSSPLKRAMRMVGDDHPSQGRPGRWRIPVDSLFTHGSGIRPTDVSPEQIQRLRLAFEGASRRKRRVDVEFHVVGRIAEFSTHFRPLSLRKLQVQFSQDLFDEGLDIATETLENTTKHALYFTLSRKLPSAKITLVTIIETQSLDFAPVRLEFFSVEKNPCRFYRPTFNSNTNELYIYEYTEGNLQMDSVRIDIEGHPPDYLSLMSSIPQVLEVGPGQKMQLTWRVHPVADCNKILIKKSNIGLFHPNDINFRNREFITALRLKGSWGRRIEVARQNLWPQNLVRAIAHPPQELDSRILDDRQFTLSYDSRPFIENFPKEDDDTERPYPPEHQGIVRYY